MKSLLVIAGLLILISFQSRSQLISDPLFTDGGLPVVIPDTWKYAGITGVQNHLLSDQAYDNRAFIIQVGEFNHSFIMQEGTLNLGFIAINGMNNGNLSTPIAIRQAGSGNYGEIIIDGSENLASIAEYGSGNVALTVVSGQNNIAHTDITGSNNIPLWQETVYSSGANNKVFIEINGSYNRLSIYQFGGLDNFANVLVDSDHNYADILQSGSRNSVKLTQR